MINKCLAVNSKFCSEISTTKFSQLFDIIIIEFFLNSLKFLSNFTIIWISWDRFCLLIGKKSKLAEFYRKNFEKIFKIPTYLILLALSVILNIDKLLIYKVNDNYLEKNEYDYIGFPSKNNLEYLFYIPKLLDQNQIKHLGELNIKFLYFYAVNFFLNDFIMYFFMFLVDMFVCIKLKLEIDKKKSLQKMLNKNQIIKLVKAKETKVKVTSLILVNAIITFLLRSIHMGFSLFIFYNKINGSKFGNICFVLKKICWNYQEAGELFYLLSNTYSLFFYYQLNRNFRIVFKSLFSLKNT